MSPYSEHEDWHQMFFDSAMFCDEDQASVCMLYLQDVFRLVNAEDDDILLIAAQRDYFAYISCLLEHHGSHSEATINMLNANRDTPLIVAATCGHAEIVELLLNTGSLCARCRRPQW